MAELNVAVASIIARFDERRVALWEEYFGDEMSGGQHRFLRLALRLYAAHAQGRPPYKKTDVARFIPVEHNASAVKYLQIAENRGWIQFIPDPRDRRKIQVHPTEMLLQMTRIYLSELAKAIVATDAALAKVGDPRV